MLFNKSRHHTRASRTAPWTKGACIAMVAFGAQLGFALAEDAKVKKISLSLRTLPGSEINVMSSDGDRWDTIVSGTINLRADVNVDTKYPGYVERAAIFLGYCANTARSTGCKDHVRLSHRHPMSRDFKTGGEINFDVTQLDGDGPGGGIRDKILSACNTGQSSADRSHQAPVELFATLQVNTRKARFMKYAIPPEDDTFIGGDASVAQPFSVRVNCNAFQQIQGPPEPYSVDVLVQPYGGACPQKTDVTAIIKYRVPATAKFRFKVDGKLSKLITIKARKKTGKIQSGGPGTGVYYLVKRLKTYYLDPGQHHFRVEVQGGKKSAVKTLRIECPPFAVTGVSLDYKVKDVPYCPKDVNEKVKATATRPGKAAFVIKTAGGLTVHSGTAEFKRKGMQYLAVIKRKLQLGAFKSDMMADFTNRSANSGWTLLEVDCMQRLDAALDVSDTTTRRRCPRNGKIKVEMDFDRFGEKVRYRVDCTGGRSWTRDTISKKKRNGDGFGIRQYLDFKVKKSEHVQCALKDLHDSGKVVALAGHKFQCVIPTVEPPSGGLTVQPPKQPTNPPRDVTVSQPQCRFVWKTQCQTISSRECHNVVDRDCRMVPKQVCTRRPKNVCRNVNRRVCKTVRGRRVCRNQIERRCRRSFEKVCRRKMQRVCSRKVKRVCRTVPKRSCKRVRERICK